MCPCVPQGCCDYRCVAREDKSFDVRWAKGAQWLPGLASAGGEAIRVWLPLVIGVALLTAFAVRSGRIARPLLDIRLYRSQAYAASSLINFGLGAVVFGGMILLPLYSHGLPRPRGVTPDQVLRAGGAGWPA